MSRALQAGLAGLGAIVLLSTVSLQQADARIQAKMSFRSPNTVLLQRPTAGTRRLLGPRIATERAFQPRRSTIIR